MPSVASGAALNGGHVQPGERGVSAGHYAPLHEYGSHDAQSPRAKQAPQGALADAPSRGGVKRHLDTHCQA